MFFDVIEWKRHTIEYHFITEKSVHFYFGKNVCSFSVYFFLVISI